MGVHSRYSASSAKRWLACPGSIELCETVERSAGSIYANIGTSAHTLAEQWLRSAQRPAAPLLCEACGSLIATPPCAACGSSRYVEAPELVDAIRHYVSFVLDLVIEFGAKIWLEKRMSHDEIANFGGTSDCVAHYYCPEVGGYVVHVVDYKNGTGVVVDGDHNEQILAYLLLAANSMRDRIDVKQVVEFRGTIVQPNAVGWSGPQTYGYTGREIKEFRKQVIRAQSSSELACGSHCRWCDAKAVCPAWRAELEHVAAQAFASFESEEDDLAIATWIVEQSDVIKSVVAAAHDYMRGMIASGRDVPGYKLVESLGNRQWASSEPTVIKALVSRGMAKRDLFESKLLSPAKIEKLAGDKHVCDGLTVRPSTAPKLVPTTHSGSPIVPGDAFLSYEDYE